MTFEKVLKIALAFGLVAGFIFGGFLVAWAHFTIFIEGAAR